MQSMTCSRIITVVGQTDINLIRNGKEQLPKVLIVMEDGESLYSSTREPCRAVLARLRDFD
jgi:hypothetical protein